jgi:hypothetical protein
VEEVERERATPAPTAARRAAGDRGENYDENE